jgi:hypothetical protein
VKRVSPIIATAFLLVLLAGCGSPEPQGNGRGQKSRAPRQAQTPRQSTDGKALYALPELRLAARTLVERISKGKGGGLPRVALSTFSLRNRKSSLGESIARDLATLLVQEARGRVEIYTRRKLTDAARELKRQQSDLFDERTMVQLGRFSGVEYILLGHLDDGSAEELRCNCQILDVETAEITSGARFAIPLRSLTVPIHTRDEGIVEFSGRLLANRVDRERDLRIGVFGVTRNRKDFSSGTAFVKELSTELPLAGGGGIKVFSRHDIDRALDELALQSSDLFDETTQAKIGNFVGANCVLTGFAEIYRKFYKFNLVFIDVESSRLLSGEILNVKRK